MGPGLEGRLGVVHKLDERSVMMETFSELINRLNLTAENRLELDEVPMVLMPLWFFVGIMKRIGAEVVGSEVGTHGQT